jgi:Raf kinase inhibitor-like YbhB/YbcL family protein|tara:strand:+ start:76 stop:546 length:471 start_codon:yes stop_codon:yes gene_type:complete
MKITSTAFEHEGWIPSKYTAYENNIIPPLSWSEVPEATKSFVLIMDDPDVPAAIRPTCKCSHWVLFNIPSNVREIKEGESPIGNKGTTTKGNTDYFGPRPPVDFWPTKHHYYFKLFALNTILNLKEGATQQEVEEVMEGKVIEGAVLIGLYDQTRK